MDITKVTKLLNCIYTNDTIEWFKSVNVLRIAYANDSYRAIDYTMHNHSFYELHIVLRGSCEYSFENGENTVLNEDMYLIIKPRFSHKTLRIDDNTVRVVIAFERSSEDEKEEELPYQLNYLNEQAKDTVTMLISDKLKMDFILRYAVASAAVVQLIVPSKDYLEKSQKSYYVGCIIQYLEKNKLKPITSDDVLNYCNCSHRHLNRLLNAELNTNLSSLLAKHRLNLIAYYLQDTDLSLEDIAERCGYGSVYSMSRFFPRR